jgi:hypothetical protein
MRECVLMPKLAAARKLNEAHLLNMRLSPDMFNLTRQVRAATDHAGGSLRDVQLLAGHRSIQTTQWYIDGDTDAQRKLVSMI